MWCLWDILSIRTMTTHVSVNGNSSYEHRYKLNELFPLDFGQWTNLWPHEVSVHVNGVGGGRGVLNLHTAAGLGPGEHPVSVGGVDSEEGVRRGWRRNEVWYSPETCELIVRLEGGGFTAEEAEAEENRLWVEDITLRMHYHHTTTSASTPMPRAVKWITSLLVILDYRSFMEILACFLAKKNDKLPNY
jgi:hypothetical protein